jgi:hypothetical protein
MAAISRVYAARLAGMVVLGPTANQSAASSQPEPSKGDVAEQRATRVPKRADPVVPT